MFRRICCALWGHFYSAHHHETKSLHALNHMHFFIYFTWQREARSGIVAVQGKHIYDTPLKLYKK